jgi:hypothetical protein
MEYLMQSNEPIKFQASTLETIDTGLYEWVNETLNLHTRTNNGIYKVPLLWLGAERSFQVKNDVRYRDKVGKLILPLISINRESIDKDPAFRGTFQAHIFENPDFKGGAITVARQINQDKTQNFQNSQIIKDKKGLDQTGPNDKNNEIVYNSYVSPIPTYIKVMYTVTIRTEYQQQMNDLLTPFISSFGQIHTFFFEKDGHKYEGFIEQSFTMNNNTTNIGEDERMFETKVQIKVLGYLISEGYNRPRPALARRENRAKIRFRSETVSSDEKL